MWNLHSHTCAELELIILSHDDDDDDDLSLNVDQSVMIQCN